MAGFYSGTLHKGSNGDETKKWQQFLNTQGYGLDVDGSFGDKTYNATIDYQKKNGLTADGIVGENTWGKAGFSNINTPISAPESTPFNYADYTESDSVKQAQTNKNNAENALNSYGDFSYSKDDTFKAIMDKILNRESFSYDLNGDALYQQYKDKYTKQGKMAMQDTMGQAAAMTGGYGNSYAATAGNQAYQASLENLNDIIPELYQMAYDRYNQEGQDLLNQYGMLSDDRNMEYGLYADKYNRLASDRDYYANDYNSERAYDYGKYSDDKSYAYNAHRNEIADAQWNANFNEGKRQYELNLAENKRQFDLVNSSSSGGSGGSGDGGGGGDNTQITTGGVSDSIRNRAESFESNIDLGNYLDGLVATGALTETQADQLYAELADTNEKFTTDENGKTTTTYSYKGMVGSSKGWTVVDDGGGNLFGIDNNAKVKTPNGETITLKNLKNKLIKEGMKASDATKAIKKLQQNLGISSNWFFGL